MDTHGEKETAFVCVKTRTIQSVGIVSFYEEFPKLLKDFSACFQLPFIPSSELIQEKLKGDIAQRYSYEGVDFRFIVELNRDSNEYPFLDIQFLSEDASKQFYLKVHSNRSSYPHTTLMANQLSIYAQDSRFGRDLVDCLDCWLQKTEA